MTARHFRAGIRQWRQRTQDQLVRIARAASQDLAEAVVDATPVDTGNLRRAWWASFDGDTNPDPESVDGSASFALSIATLQVGAVLTIRNGQAYARRIEYGFVGDDALGRTYAQQGRHMMTDRLPLWQRYVDAAARRIVR